MYFEDEVHADVCLIMEKEDGFLHKTWDMQIRFSDQRLSKGKSLNFFRSYFPTLVYISWNPERIRNLSIHLLTGNTDTCKKNLNSIHCK